jgi:hypothetical protein
MNQRCVCAAVLAAAAAVAACGSKQGGSAGTTPTAPTTPTIPSRAAATGEFPDNPMLAFAPADAPYAFASFKPFPPAVIHKVIATLGPIWRRAFGAALAKTGEAGARAAAAMEQEFETIETKGLEALGLSTSARLAIYGMGAYPVMRVEISNGDRVYELVQRVSARLGHGLMPPRGRAGRRYWIFDLPMGALFVSLAPREMVAAFAPRAQIDANLAILLGERPAPNHLTTAQFRELAARDGFTGLGVGFVDVVRVGALIADAAGAPPGCRDAVVALARRSPRVAFGYDELTVQHMAFGMVVEIAPDLLAELRKLAGSLVGFERLIGRRPAMAFAVAANIAQGVAVLSRAAGAAHELGERCQAPGLVDSANKLAEAIHRPLPPFVAGVHGAYVVVDDLKLGANGPESIEGFATVQIDRADEVVKMATSQLPGLTIAADGKAQPLPALIPFPGHVAASTGAIAVALGPTSATTVPALLADRALPAPLMVMEFDYGRLGDLVLGKEHSAELADMRKIMQMFGLAILQVLVDERGVVTWASFELR